MGFFSELSLFGRIAFVASLIAAIGAVYGLWHHTIYKSGEDACQARYTAAAAAQATKATKEIVTLGAKYAKIDQTMQQSAGFTRPVSPLVADAIGRLPNPSPHSK